MSILDFLLLVSLYLPWGVFLGVVTATAVPCGPQLVTKPLGWFKISDQVRKTFDEEDLRRLGESLKQKQLQPVLCQPDGTLIAGERRYRAAKLVGLATLEVKIAEEPLTPSQVKLWQIQENMQRADLTDAEVYLGVKDLLALNETWQRADVAEKINKSASMVTRILAVDDLIPAAREAFLGGAFRFSKAYEISKASEQEQHQILAAILAGASRDEVARQGRKQRNGSTSAVRVAKVKCQLPSGVQIVVSGEAISLDEAAEALAQAIKEMKRASELGYTAKTFAAAMKGRATKG